MHYWIILSLAFILRLILLNQSLWLDEASEAMALMGQSGSSLFSYILADYQPPLYHAIGYFFTHLLGYSEIVLRLPSLISGIFTVYFVIKIAELLGSKKIGMIAGLLAATNPLLIYYSQEGRTYAMTTFLVTASFYYFIKLLQSKNRDLPSTIYYLVSTTAFLWTSYLSWFVLLGQGIYVIWKKRYDLLLLQTITAITLLAWLPSFITSLGIGQFTRELSPEWGKVVGGLSWKSLPLTWVKFNIGRIGFDNKILYGALVTLIGLLHISALKFVNYRKYFVFLVWLIPPVILGLMMASILPVFAYFRVLFVLPAYLLLLAIGSQRISKVIILFNILFLIIFWFSPRYHRENWRQLARDLPSNAVVAMPSRAQSTPLLYYSFTNPIIEPSHEELSGKTIYYIRYAEDLFDPTKLGQTNFITSGYTITGERSYSGIQVDIYENRN